MSARRKAKSSPVGDNLELLGDRLEVVSLQALLTNKKRPETRDAARLGDVLLPWYENAVVKPSAKMGHVAELWQQHVPERLLGRTRLVKWHRGTLTVSVDSAAARVELETLLRAGLLRTLQLVSKGALFRIKATVESGVADEPQKGQL